jgi:hypothetical protein
MSTLRRAAAPRAEAPTQAEADTLRAEVAAAHIQVAAAHIPVHQAAAGSRAAADTVRHWGSIFGHTAPGAIPAGTGSARHSRSIPAQPKATQSESQCGCSCRDFPIPRFATYVGKTAKFGHRTWEKSQRDAAQLRMLNEILQRCSVACGGLHATRSTQPTVFFSSAEWPRVTNCPRAPA